MWKIYFSQSLYIDRHKFFIFLVAGCSEQILLPYIYSLKTYVDATNTFSKANDACLAPESTDFCLEEVISKAKILWHNFRYKRRTLF